MEFLKTREIIKNNNLKYKKEVMQFFQPSQRIETNGFHGKVRTAQH